MSATKINLLGFTTVVLGGLALTAPPAEAGGSGGGCNFCAEWCPGNTDEYCQDSYPTCGSDGSCETDPCYGIDGEWYDAKLECG